MIFISELLTISCSLTILPQNEAKDCTACVNTLESSAQCLAFMAFLCLIAYKLLRVLHSFFQLVSRQILKKCDTNFTSRI